LRAEAEPIEIGAGTNIQDGRDHPRRRRIPGSGRDRVSVGHNAVLHGCTVEDGALIEWVPSS